jgi:CHAD domain-containing protein
VSAPPFTPAARGKPAKLRAAVRAADRKVTKHLSSGLVGDDGAELHKARKAGKRARYAAELGRPVLGKKKATNSVHRYQNLQAFWFDVLGALTIGDAVPADSPLRPMMPAAG